MDKSTAFNPNWASMPGDTIANILSQRKISLSDFSKMMHSNIHDVKGLLHGFIVIDNTIAQKLHSSLGGSIEYWLRREQIYRGNIERLKEAEGEKWVKELPVNSMKKYKWIGNGGDIIEECLNYFGVPDVWTWRKKYSDVTTLVSFRKSIKLKSSAASLSVWVRQGEIQSEFVELLDWDREKFQSSLLEIKRMSMQKNPSIFLPRLKKICAECGVALAIAPTPVGCAASGVAKFMSPKKALILLSFRFKSDDQFWFTFFHEAGHLLLHSEKGIMIDEDQTGGDSEKEEHEANQFALNILFPGKLKQELESLRPTEVNIKNLAKKANVSLGIVVGQLRFLGKIPPNYFVRYIKRYKWEDIQKSIN